MARTAAGAGAAGGGGVRKAQAAETQAALKDAAQRVFARSGYVNARITDITSEAGRAAGSFYSHFDSKETLLESLLVDLLETGDRRAAEPGHSGDFSDPAAVRWHVALFWGFVKEQRPLIRALQQAALVDDRFAARMRELVTPSIHDLADHLALWQARGGVLPGDPVVVASAMVSLMSQFAYTWLLEEDNGLGRGGIGDDEAIDTMTGLLTHGILGHPPNAAPPGGPSGAASSN